MLQESQTGNSEAELLARQANVKNELARRLAMGEPDVEKSGFLNYVMRTTPNYIVGRHHIEICQALDRVIAGTCRRLMVFLHPGAGKSTLISMRFPAYYLGHNPQHQVIAGSYGGELVSGFGRELRNLMNGSEHLGIFPDCGLATDSQAKNLWRTEQGGVYLSAGVGGAITGFGMHLGIIDDPVKSRQEADSEHMRELTWRWYKSDFYTRQRLDPKTKKVRTALIYVATRWHEDDLAGRLLKAMEDGTGDQWEVLHYPALDEKGRALWPEGGYDEEYLEGMRGTLGAREWQSLFQGDPTPDEGLVFKEDWFWEYEEKDLMMEVALPLGPDGKVPDGKRMIPRPMTYYGASDYAVTDGDGDFTVHIVVGVDPLDNIYIMDLWREQTTSDVWVEKMLDMSQQWNPMLWAEEKGQIEKGVGPLIVKRQNERRIYFHRKAFASSVNKRQRSQAIVGRMAMGKVRFPKNAPWYPALKNEMLKFDAGKHDDQVDTISLIGRMLEGMTPGRLPNEGLPPGTPGLHINVGQDAVDGTQADDVERSLD